MIQISQLLLNEKRKQESLVSWRQKEMTLLLTTSQILPLMFLLLIRDNLTGMVRREKYQAPMVFLNRRQNLKCLMEDQPELRSIWMKELVCSNQTKKGRTPKAQEGK